MNIIMVTVTITILTMITVMSLIMIGTLEIHLKASPTLECLLAKLMSHIIDVLHYYHSLINYVSTEIAPLESTTAATSALKPDTDVIFMLDASKNVSPEDYVRQKEFVKSMVRVLHIRAVEPFIRGPRACVIIYSSNAYLIFDFTEYATIEDFETKLDSAVLLRESWKVAKALHLSFKMFSMASTSRKMVAVLVTAGHYDEESYVDEESLDASTQGLRDLRARTYIIAIGDVSKSRKLEPLVASPEDIFVVSSTDELNSVVSPLVEHIRETYGKLTLVESIY